MELVVDTVTNWLNRSMTNAASRVIARDTQLIELGVLDSIEILNLVSFLEERFGIALPIDEFVPENFQSAQTIAGLVERLGHVTLAA
jgi:acyl carrier protein